MFVGSPLILYVQSNMCRGVPRGREGKWWEGKVESSLYCNGNEISLGFIGAISSHHEYLQAPRDCTGHLYCHILMDLRIGCAHLHCLCDVCRHSLLDVLKKGCKQMIILYYGLNEIVNYPSIITERLPVGMFATFLSLLKASSSFCCL